MSLYTVEVVHDDGMALRAACTSATERAQFNWAGGTIYGGSIYQTMGWCYEGGRGTITSSSCTAGHDQIFPYSFSGWAMFCNLVAGGNGYLSIERQSEGIFVNTAGWGVYPCAGTVGDAFGNF